MKGAPVKRSTMVGLVLVAAAVAVPGCGGSGGRLDGRHVASLRAVALERMAAGSAEEAVSRGTGILPVRGRAILALQADSATGRMPVERMGGTPMPRPQQAARLAAAWPGVAAVLDAPEDAAPTDGPEAPVETPPADRWWQKPLAGRSPGEVIKDDLRLLPRELWKSTKDSATVPNLLILSAAGGLSAVSRGSWDHRVDRSFRNHEGSLFEKTGDTGSVLGSPLLHFGVALTAYGYSVAAEDDELYGFSKSLTQALILNGLVTSGLKAAAHDYSPNGEAWAWPSGHTSSTATVAAVAWEYYGWKAGLPLYLVTGFVAASRLEDREHWLSDVVFGAALGAVIGHSVAQGRQLEVGGFTVLPYVHPEGGAGIMFAKQF